MDILGFVILVSLIIVSLFNYLNLKKLNFPSKKCLYSSIIVFVVSFFSTSYLAIFLSMFFESFTSNINIFSIIALILVLVFNYFRIKERVIKNKKIDYKKGGIYEKIV
jgi:amino acid transporter